jgi:hypothetical protein
MIFMMLWKWKLRSSCASVFRLFSSSTLSCKCAWILRLSHNLTASANPLSMQFWSPTIRCPLFTVRLYLQPDQFRFSTQKLDMSVSKYSIVKFPGSGRKQDIEIEIVPTNWIRSDKHCYWPPHSGAALKKLQKDGAPLLPTWKVFPTSVY